MKAPDRSQLGCLIIILGYCLVMLALGRVREREIECKTRQGKECVP